MNWLKKYRSLDRAQRLSILFTVFIVVGLLLLFIGLVSYIKVTPYKVYKNSKVGLEIKFPADWGVNLHPEAGAVVSFVAPKDGPLDPFYENMNISIKEMPQAMTIEHLSNLIVKQVVGTLGEQIDITRTIPANIGGRSGYRLTFAGYGSNIPNPIQYTIAWTIIENRVYILTFTGLKQDSSKYEKRVETMIASFRFIPIDPQFLSR